jgi:hypothetical protein
MIRIGLVGMPKSGKTTVFNAVTGSNVPVTDYYTQSPKPNIGIVSVVDKRLDYLQNAFSRPKIVYATIEYFDFAGIKKTDGRALSDQFLGELRTVDALALVIRRFELSGMEVAPVKEMSTCESELIFSDLAICEKRLETIEKDKKRGVKSPEIENEEKVLEKVYNCLNENKPLRTLDLTEPELKLMRGYQFLTLKPAFVILNSDEEHYTHNQELLNEIGIRYDAVEIAGSLEMELQQIKEPERGKFMQEFGIRESAVNKLTQVSYKTLGLVSFFTIGKNEVRAWTLPQGSTALDAAATIHTDIAKGFVRAERYTFDDFQKYGSEKQLKSAGKFYLEGKDYIVQDGDILYILHS